MMKNKKRCVIICASPEFHVEQLEEADVVIVCDGGYNYAKEHEIKPDLFIGDFDSYFGDVEDGVEVIHAPTVKDDTDALLAVKFAMESGVKDFLLLGATGGRIDHQFANFAVAAYIADNGGCCEMIDKNNRIYSIKNQKITLNKKLGWSLSVFSYSDKSVGVNLTGVKYPLTDATITNTFPIGVSNEITEEQATIEVESGILLIVMSNTNH